MNSKLILAALLFLNQQNTTLLNWENTKSENSSYQISENNIISTNEEDKAFFINNDLELEGNYSLSCNIQGTMDFPNTKLTRAGLLPWYLDENNYILVYLQWSDTDRTNQLHQIQFTGKINGDYLNVWQGNQFYNSEFNDIWTDNITISSTSNVKFTVDRVLINNSYYLFYFKLNDQTINKKALKYDEILSQKGKIGVYSQFDTFTFSNITKEDTSFSADDSPYQVIGDWSFVGPNKLTWSYDQDNNLINGVYDYGTEYLATSAYYKNEEKKNFFMRSTINISAIASPTGSGNIEYKAGLMPYYKNIDNYVFCWLSVWSDGRDPHIVITAKLNGQIIYDTNGSEWRESQWLTNIPFTNVDCLMEIEVKDDLVKVYLNRSVEPYFTTEINNLSSRDLTRSSVGLNFENVNLTYKDTGVLLDERNRVVEKPIIQELGTRKTSGILNQTIKLPIYTATNSLNEIMTPTIKISSPSNQNVELTKNSFIPTELGNYHVIVSCEDLYGNIADPIEYDINIIDEKIIDDNHPEEKNNTPLIIGLSIGGAVILLGIILTILKIKKII